jgi:tRNA pseudouridine32 synthase/23S rRNA pseudouridine746 synthase
VAPDDFASPLQLFAQRLEFDDPLGGCRREFVSTRKV